MYLGRRASCVCCAGTYCDVIGNHVNHHSIDSRPSREKSNSILLSTLIYYQEFSHSSLTLTCEKEQKKPVGLFMGPFIRRHTICLVFCDKKKKHYHVKDTHFKMFPDFRNARKKLCLFFSIREPWWPWTHFMWETERNGILHPKNQDANACCLGSVIFLW